VAGGWSDVTSDGVKKIFKMNQKNQKESRQAGLGNEKNGFFGLGKAKTYAT
jgi:hypothetical protein